MNIATPKGQTRRRTNSIVTGQRPSMMASQRGSQQPPPEQTFLHNIVLFVMESLEDF